MRESISKQYAKQIAMTNYTNTSISDIKVGQKYYVNVYGIFKTQEDRENEIVPY